MLPNLRPDLAQDIKPFEIHRLKAKLYMQDRSVKIVQGVREVFEILDAPQQTPQDTQTSSVEQGKVVLIGRNLQASLFQESLLVTLEQSHQQ